MKRRLDGFFDKLNHVKHKFNHENYSIDDLANNQ